MGLKYGDALRDVTLQQILGVMKSNNKQCIQYGHIKE